MNKTIRIFIFFLFLSSCIAGFLVFSEQPVKKDEPKKLDKETHKIGNRKNSQPKLGE